MWTEKSISTNLKKSVILLLFLQSVLVLYANSFFLLGFNVKFFSQNIRYTAQKNKYLDISSLKNDIYINKNNRKFNFTVIPNGVEAEPTLTLINIPSNDSVKKDISEVNSL